MTRKTHSYYVVELDGCVPGWVARRLYWDRYGPSYCELLSVVVHRMIISYGTPVDKVITLTCGNIYKVTKPHIMIDNLQ